MQIIRAYNICASAHTSSSTRKIKIIYIQTFMSNQMGSLARYMRYYLIFNNYHV